jgi:hypothetical protein
VERDARPVARRYLGAEEGDRFIEQTGDVYADSILIRMRPERWLTADYAKANL